MPGLAQVWLLGASTSSKSWHPQCTAPALGLSAHTGHWFWLPAPILCCNAEPCGCHCLLPCVCRPRNVALRPQLGYCSWLLCCAETKGGRAPIASCGEALALLPGPAEGGICSRQELVPGWRAAPSPHTDDPAKRLTWHARDAACPGLPHCFCPCHLLATVSPE